MQERFKQIVNQEGRLPTRLFIQMDNCGRENKNQYVLAFLFLLVELEVFDEVCGTICMCGCSTCKEHVTNYTIPSQV